MEALLGGWYLEAALALLEKGAEGLGEALARLGEGLGVDRAYLFRLEAQEGAWYATQLSEWTREGVTPQLGNPLLTRVPMAQGYGRWVERFLEGRPIQGAVRTFPEEERPLLEAQDIQALLAVPVFLEGRLWGFLGVDACRGVRAFREDEVELLKGLARVLALSLNLLERVRRLEGLLEKTPLYVLRFSPEGALLYANPAARGLPLALPLEAALETPGEAVRVHALGAEWTLLAVPGPGGEVLEVLALGLDVREKDEAQRREALWQAFRTNLLRVYETLMAEGLSESVYGLILEAAMATIPNAQAGSVTVLKEDGYYHFVAAKGYDLKALRRVRLSPEEPLSLTGHREAQVFTQQDLARFNARLDPKRRQVMEEAGRVREIRAILSVPVFLSGERKAFLYLDNFEREEAFSPLEVELAQAFASQLGLLLRRLELEGRVQHLAYHDPLTGLPNRLFFLEKLAQVRKGAVLYLDLDGFKLVNDLSGHSAGDQALMALAARLQGAVRPRDLVARQGGDEFLVLLTDLRGPEEAVAVAERLLEVVRLPLPVGGRIYHLSVSIGIALVEEALGPGEVLKRADLALYRAKAEGKDRIAFYEEGLQEKLREEFDLLEALREDLAARKGFWLAYQPIVDLERKEPVALEALLRWRVSPALFIPLAERHRLIGALGELALGLALEEQSRHGLPVHVNVSPQELLDPGYPGRLALSLEEAGLPPEALVLEVTETALAPDERGRDALKSLEVLRALGVRVYLDDFGSGYSSLERLASLPVDGLKLGQRFTSALGNPPDPQSPAARVVAAVLALGQALGLPVVAEGIEHKATLAYLRSLGFRLGQGFLLGRPEVLS